MVVATYRFASYLRTTYGPGPLIQANNVVITAARKEKLPMMREVIRL